MAHEHDDGPKVVVDKQGRVCNNLGRPLRDKPSRSYAGPYMGKESGSAHPRAQRLAARQKGFDDLRRKDGHKRPGSNKK